MNENVFIGMVFLTKFDSQEVRHFSHEVSWSDIFEFALKCDFGCAIGTKINNIINVEAEIQMVNLV